MDRWVLPIQARAEDHQIGAILDEATARQLFDYLVVDRRLIAEVELDERKADHPG
jgi:hypothetical protein